MARLTLENTDNPFPGDTAILKAKVKPNYTEAQNQIADWIKHGHNADLIRTVPKLRCYITSAYISHWYSFLKTGRLSGGIGEELPNGNFRLKGNRPGGYTHDYKSRFCGTVITSYDRKTP